jgi:hypothetical protein
MNGSERIRTNKIAIIGIGEGPTANGTGRVQWDIIYDTCKEKEIRDGKGHSVATVTA